MENQQLTSTPADLEEIALLLIDPDQHSTELMELIDQVRGNPDLAKEVDDLLRITCWLSTEPSGNPQIVPPEDVLLHPSRYSTGSRLLAELHAACTSVQEPIVLSKQTIVPEPTPSQTAAKTRGTVIPFRRRGLKAVVAIFGGAAAVALAASVALVIIQSQYQGRPTQLASNEVRRKITRISTGDDSSGHDVSGADDVGNEADVLHQKLQHVETVALEAKRTAEKAEFESGLARSVANEVNQKIGGPGIMNTATGNPLLADNTEKACSKPTRLVIKVIDRKHDGEPTLTGDRFYSERQYASTWRYPLRTKLILVSAGNTVTDVEVVSRPKPITDEEKLAFKFSKEKDPEAPFAPDSAVLNVSRKVYSTLSGGATKGRMLGIEVRCQPRDAVKG